MLHPLATDPSFYRRARRRQAKCPLHRGRINFLASLKTVVELRQSKLRGSRRRGRAGDCDTVPPRDNRNAKLSFNPVEMLVSFAVEQREQQVVVKFQLRPTFELFGGRHLRGEWGHDVAAWAREPERLLVLAPEIRPGTISPSRAGAVTWTLWR